MEKQNTGLHDSTMTDGFSDDLKHEIRFADSFTFSLFPFLKITGNSIHQWDRKYSLQCPPI